MSELKAYIHPLKKNMIGNTIVGQSYYLKSEADKVIAHHKYKRCLAMADKCSEALCYWDNVKYTFFKGEAYCFRKMNHYGKWGQIWLAIAEKFKEGV